MTQKKKKKKKKKKRNRGSSVTQQVADEIETFRVISSDPFLEDRE